LLLWGTEPAQQLIGIHCCMFPLQPRLMYCMPVSLQAFAACRLVVSEKPKCAALCCAVLRCAALRWGVLCGLPCYCVAAAVYVADCVRLQHPTACCAALGCGVLCCACWALRAAAAGSLNAAAPHAAPSHAVLCPDVLCHHGTA
jgi:hypothetical protein